jgi:hypothetical protein
MRGGAAYTSDKRRSTRGERGLSEVKWLRCFQVREGDVGDREAQYLVRGGGPEVGEGADVRCSEVVASADIDENRRE